MSITLGTVDISNNMYLKGVQSANQVYVQQDRSLNGDSFLTVQKIQGGRSFVLGTVNSGSLMGIWTSSIVDAVKVLEESGQAQVLNYRGTLYTVIIVEVTMEPLYIHELEGPDKKYTGTITLLEAN